MIRTSIAEAPFRRRPSWAGWVVGGLWLASLAGCAAGVGISIPIGRAGSIGVGVDSDGRVSGGVTVGRGGVAVGVGGSGQIPQAPQAPASAASATSR